MNLRGILEISGRTDTGKVRSNNEDCFTEDAQIGLVVLADGMGGYKGGEVASSIAVKTVHEQLSAQIPALEPGAIEDRTGYSMESISVRNAILKANRLIYKTSQKEAKYQGMGTTLVAGVFYNNRIIMAHVGDSRMYRFRNNQLQQVTSDHTLLQELVDRGFYTLDEANASLNKNLVTRALGIEESVAVDVKEDIVFPGDIYLLCSDGLSDMLTDIEIQTILENHGANLDKAADLLIDLANRNGGKDNVSVMLARTRKTFPFKKKWHSKLFGLMSKNPA